jgi:hypothetical protein
MSKQHEDIMEKASFKSAHTYLLNKPSELKQVLSKASVLNELNAKLATHLDPAIARYCQVANLRDNKLIVLVANASIAMQLRFQATNLLQHLKKDPRLSMLQDIFPIVRPSTETPRLKNAPAHKLPPLSAASAQAILDSADTLQDPSLKKIMQKIAKHLKMPIK